MKLPVRQPIAGGSRRPPRVGGALLARGLGIALVVAAGAAMYWLTTADNFRLDPERVVISGLSYTGDAEVRRLLGLRDGAQPNVVRLRPSVMADTLRGLPAVAAVDVVVALPDRLEIAVVERQPLLAWRTSRAEFLVDAGGMLIAERPADAPAALPALDDRRATGAALALGGRLDEVDLAAARLLLTITPHDVGSRSTGLQLTLDDADGWSVVSLQPPWRAVFGFYTANLRRPEELVPRQRQCLASLLAAGEERLATVYLAVDGDRCGTFRERPTPSAQLFQNVGRPGA